MLVELELFFSSKNNYKIYRESLQTSDQPTIPHMAIFLQDLTFIEDGNPSMVKGLINFEQKRQLYRVIAQVQSMQEIPYQFFRVMPLYHLLRRLPSASDKQLYQMSMVSGLRSVGSV